MPLLSFLDENRGNILVTKLSCLVNVFPFQFKVHSCRAFFLFFFFSEPQTEVRNTGEP